MVQSPFTCLEPPKCPVVVFKCLCNTNSLSLFKIIAFDELRTDFKNPIDQSNPTRAVRLFLGPRFLSHSINYCASVSQLWTAGFRDTETAYMRICEHTCRILLCSCVFPQRERILNIERICNLLRKVSEIVADQVKRKHIKREEDMQEKLAIKKNV